MKIFCTREIAQNGLVMLREAGHQVTFWGKDEPIPQEDLIAICQSRDALIVADRRRIDAHFLQACSNLKIIALHFIGYDAVDVQEAQRLHILISNTPNAGSRETADTAFMLMIAASKNAFTMYRRLMEGSTGPVGPLYNLGISLRNKTLGIFGLGDIGMEMTRLCQVAYQMEIIYHNRRPNIQAESRFHARMVSFEELLRQSDVLSVHAALNKDTREKFDTDAFSRMKPTAIFVNTARGAIHNENALIRALKDKIIRGAGLDVSNPEPMHPDNPLLHLPNVAVTPHIGSAIDTAREQMSMMVAQNILAVADGRPAPNEIRIYSGR